MRGELLGVWSESWLFIWEPLVSQEGVPSDIFCELYRELSQKLRSRPSLEQIADIVDNQTQSLEAFRSITADELSSEQDVVAFFEEAHDVVSDLAGPEIAKSYANLLSAFVEKFSLRYQLREPCVLCPTLPGIFATLFRELRLATRDDAHVSALLKDFDDALRDLRDDVSDGRIKTIIQKQINVLEAVGAACNGVQANQLGTICNELRSWPHNAVRNSLSNLYGFASDYPGIRHAGNPAGALRAIDMRDFIAVSVVLAGFTPYLRDNFSSDAVFWGTATQVPRP